jgi:hypothetical protein
MGILLLIGAAFILLSIYKAPVPDTADVISESQQQIGNAVASTGNVNSDMQNQINNEIDNYNYQKVILVNPPNESDIVSPLSGLYNPQNDDIVVNTPVLLKKPVSILNS